MSTVRQRNWLTDTLRLTPAGLTSLSPGAIKTWIERVRAGGLNPTETAAALGFVYRMWLVGLLFKAIGSGWDVAWHFQALRDDFAPPHNINLVGDGIVIAIVLFHWYTRLGVDRLALRLMIAGVVLFVGSAPVDVINHRLNGLDITSWSITHFGLYTGTAIMILGGIRGWRVSSTGRPDRPLLLTAFWFFFLENIWFPNQHQEYGTEAIRAWDRGEPYAEQELLDFAASQMGRPVDRDMLVAFSLPVPAWVYPVWIVAAAGITLVMARRSVGLKWTATTIAAGYLAWRCVLYPILMATSYPTSAVPFVVLALGVAVDLVCRLKLPSTVEPAVGAVVVTAAAYLGLFVQSYLLVAPPVSYWSSLAAAAILLLAWSGLNLYRRRRGAELL
jgi:hypothetical protein